MELDVGMTSDDFKFFGKMDSHKYREKFMDSTKMAKLTAHEMFMVVLFTVVVKNRERILDGLKMKSKDWGRKTWFKNVVNYFTNYTRQYNTEKSDKMPVVNIPSCVPFIAANAFVMITGKANLRGTNGKKIFLENLFSIQFEGLTDDEIEIQKKWEKNFWDKVVTKTRAQVKDEYNKFKGFQEAFWETKKGDNYNLVSYDGTTLFDMKDYEAWLDTFP